jgi:hypothetical protein
VCFDGRSFTSQTLLFIDLSRSMTDATDCS